MEKEKKRAELLQKLNATSEGCINQYHRNTTDSIMQLLNVVMRHNQMPYAATEYSMTYKENEVNFDRSCTPFRMVRVAKYPSVWAVTHGATFYYIEHECFYEEQLEAMIALVALDDERWNAPDDV